MLSQHLGDEVEWGGGGVSENELKAWPGSVSVSVGGTSRWRLPRVCNICVAHPHTHTYARAHTHTGC